MDQANSGASNAQDFQPLTRNPQGNVGGGLQPNAASPSNLFQQQGTNQQNLPSTQSLQVLNNGPQNTTAVAPPTTSGINWSFYFLIFVVLVVASIGLNWFIKRTRSQDMSEDIEGPEPVNETVSVVESVPVQTITPPKPKKKSKKRRSKSSKKK